MSANEEERIHHFIAVIPPQHMVAYHAASQQFMWDHFVTFNAFLSCRMIYAGP